MLSPLATITGLAAPVGLVAAMPLAARIGVWWLFVLVGLLGMGVMVLGFLLTAGASAGRRIDGAQQQRIRRRVPQGVNVVMTGEQRDRHCEDARSGGSLQAQKSLRLSLRQAQARQAQASG